MVNLRTFDLNLLRTLAALLDEPRVSSAARQLNLSQPATSAALARLRQAFDDPLLVRAGHQMVLTALARELRPNVRRILADIEQTLRMPAKFDPAASERSFRIAANDYAVMAVLSQVLESIQQQAPRTMIEILPFDEDFEARLGRHDYDLAIRDRWSIRGWRHQETLFNEEYVCIASRDHPRLSRKPTLDQFLAEGHVLISSVGRSPGVVDAALECVGRRRRIAVTLPHFLAAPAIVARTEYVMTIARRVAQQVAPLYNARIFAPPIPIRGFDVAMAWHPGSVADAGVDWLKDQVRNAIRQRNPQRAVPANRDPA
jgi:DNA-binding transcriptional LysR family regulator